MRRSSSAKFARESSTSAPPTAESALFERRSCARIEPRTERTSRNLSSLSSEGCLVSGSSKCARKAGAVLTSSSAIGRSIASWRVSSARNPASVAAAACVQITT